MAEAVLLLAALPEGYSLVRCDANALSPAEFNSAIGVLQQGGAVNIDSARDEIPTAVRFVILKYHDELVGLGAIKRERQWYALSIQKNSGHAFPLETPELGYVAVHRKHSGLRLSGHIVNRLLDSYNGDLFATTDHPHMKSTLGNRGFVQVGQEWQGVRDALSLWFRIRSEFEATKP